MWKSCFLFLGSWTAWPTGWHQLLLRGRVRRSQAPCRVPCHAYTYKHLSRGFNCVFLFYHIWFFPKFNVSKNQNGAIICVQIEKPRLLTKWKKISLFKNLMSYFIVPSPSSCFKDSSADLKNLQLIKLLGNKRSGFS